MVEVIQTGIVFTDQVQFPVTVPVFELFFPFDGISRTGERLGMHEFGAVVFLRKAVNVPASMLTDAALEVVRYTDVDDSLASIHEDVNPVLV